MKKLLVMIVLVTMVVAFCGCSLMQGTQEAEEELIVNGTTTGNILNHGFAVQYDEDLIFLYTGQDVYDYGSVVRSNPETGENSLFLQRGGLYMNVVNDCLYYCRKDGVYKTPLDTPTPSLVVTGEVSLLQISGDNMYFIRDKHIDCTTLEGQPVEQFSVIENAGYLNVYEEKLYYIDTDTGYICEAAMDGNDISVVYEQGVDMFYIIDDVIYFIDSADGNIKRLTLLLEGLETVVQYPCSGFNINRYGMYYTRDIDGRSVCCNAGADGEQENVIADFGESRWHIVCMWGDGAMVIKEEQLQAFK